MTLLVLATAAIGFLVGGFTGAAVGVLVGIVAIPIMWAMSALVVIAGGRSGQGNGDPDVR